MLVHPSVGPIDPVAVRDAFLHALGRGNESLRQMVMQWKEAGPRFDIRHPLHQLTGVDLTQIDAIGPYSVLRLLAEIGIDMSRWPTEKHFTSWLTLAPHNKITGGRLLSSHGEVARPPKPRHPYPWDVSAAAVLDSSKSES